MRTRGIALLASFGLLAGTSGCAPDGGARNEAAAGAGAVGDAGVGAHLAQVQASTCLNSARFDSDNNPSHMVTLAAANGKPFKANPTKEDVQSSLRDAAGNYHGTTASTAVAATALGYKANLRHQKSQNVPPIQVHARAKCADNQWSDWDPDRKA